jgi:hypothetical protein
MFGPIRIFGPELNAELSSCIVGREQLRVLGILPSEQVRAQT